MLGRGVAKISIVGVGDGGATLAYTIQIYGLAREIVLVDSNGEKAEAHALDMNHGLFFTPPSSIRKASLRDCEGSDLVVITAGARSRPDETRLDLTGRNAQILKGIAQELAPCIGDARVLVISNPVDVMTSVVMKSMRLPPHRVIGSGTVLDSARFRFELSRRCQVDARNVHAYVIGEHGESEVFLWSQVHIAGTSFERFCTSCKRPCTAQERAGIEQSVRDSAYHIIEKKGYTNYGVSLAVARIIGAILRDEKSVLTVSTHVDGPYGLYGICLSLPAVIGGDGLERIIETPLSRHEHEELAKSAELITSTLAAAA